MHVGNLLQLPTPLRRQLRVQASLCFRAIFVCEQLVSLNSVVLVDSKIESDHEVTKTQNEQTKKSKKRPYQTTGTCQLPHVQLYCLRVVCSSHSLPFSH